MHRKRTTTLNFSGIYPLMPFLVFVGVFLAGSLLGSILVGKFDFLEKNAAETLAQFCLIRKSGKLLPLFYDSLSSIFPLYIICFLCGTSVVGCVAAPLLLLYSGILQGSLSGYLYSSYGLEGIMFFALIILPSTLVCAFGLILLAKLAFGFSMTLSGICIKTNKPVNIYADFKVFCVSSIFVFIFAVAAVIFDCGMSAMFIGFFNF